MTAQYLVELFNKGLISLEDIMAMSRETTPNTLAGAFGHRPQYENLAIDPSIVRQAVDLILKLPKGSSDNDMLD